MTLSNHNKTGKSRPLLFRIPRNIDRSILSTDDWRFAQYMLNLIIYRKRKGFADSRGFIRIHHKTLRRVVPIRRIRRIWEALEKAGIVEIDHRSRIGSFVVQGISRGYRLAEGYRSKPERVQCEYRLAQKIRKRRQQVQDARLLPVHRWLMGNLERLTFDTQLALQIAQSSKHATDLVDKISRAASDLTWLKVDRFGRVHTPLTCMLTTAMRRSCLSVDGQKLVEIDLACSQPLFLGWLARGGHGPGPGADGYYKGCKSQSPCLGFAPLIVTNDARATGRGTGTAWLADCGAGQFYKRLATAEHITEKDSKRLFMLTCFEHRSKRYVLSSPWFKQLAHLYPAESSYLKRHRGKGLAHELQRAEATLFIGRVCERLMAERPSLPLFTVHDSLLAMPSDAKYVKDVVAAELASLGLQGLMRQKGL